MSSFCRTVTRIAGKVILLVAVACSPQLVELESDGVVQVPLEGIKSVVASVQEGNLRVEAVQVALDRALVRYRVRAAGATEAEAEDCMRNVQIDHEVSPSGILRIGWHMVGARKPYCSAVVDLTVEIPATLPLEAQTQAGALEVLGNASACRVRSRSGDIRLTGTSTDIVAISESGNVSIQGGQKVEGRSRSGRIRLKAKARHIDLASESGGVSVELDCDETVRGNIVTQSGPVMLVYDGIAPVEIEAKSSSAGAMTLRGDFDDTQNIEGQPLWARRGRNGDKISISTSSGSVHVEGHRRS